MADRYWVGGAGTWDNTGTARWSTSSGGASGASAPTSADNVFFDSASNATGYTVTIAGTAVCANLTVAGPASGNVTMSQAGNALGVYGNFSTAATGVVWAGGGGSIQFLATSGTQTVTTNGLSIFTNILINGVGGTVQLQDNFTSPATETLTLTNGTLDLNSKNFSIGQFSSSNSNARTLAFGASGQLLLTSVTGYGIVYNVSVNTNFTVTGTPIVKLTGAGVAGSTRLIYHGSGDSSTNIVNMYVTAGADTVFTPGTSSFIDFNLTGFTGTWTNPAMYYYGSLTLGAGMTITATVNSCFFRGSSGTKTITTNGVALNCPITIDGAGSTFVQQDALTTPYTFFFTRGTYSQNNFNLTCLAWDGSNSNTRVYTPGTGGTYVTGNNGVVVNGATLTGFTNTTILSFYLTYSGSTGTRTFNWGTTTGAVEGNAANFNITAGSDTINSGSSNNARIGAINFTGFSGTWGGGNCIMFGDLTLSPTMSYTAGVGNLRFYKTSGTQNITTNGVVLDVNLYQFAPGATVKLVDNLTSGSAKLFTFDAGTLDLNGKTLTIGTFSSSGALARTLGFGTNGKMVFTGAGASAFVASGTNQSLTGTGTISMTSASAKTFAGGGFAYPALSQDGAGALTISGNNTFANIANTVTPATVTLPASGTQTCAAISLAGTAGNLVTVNSGTSGVRATISKASGTVSLNYCSFTDIAVSGGVFFKALASNGCVEGTNTTGIVYAAPSQMIQVV